MTRRAERDVELGGYRVPKGVTVVMDIGAVHHHPRFYLIRGNSAPNGGQKSSPKDFTSLLIFRLASARAVSNAAVTPIAATTLRPGEGG